MGFGHGKPEEPTDEGVKVLAGRIQDEMERLFPNLANYGSQASVKRFSEFLATLFVASLRSVRSDIPPDVGALI